MAPPEGIRCGAVLDLAGRGVADGGVSPIGQAHCQAFDFAVEERVRALQRGGQSKTIARGRNRGGVSRFRLDGNCVANDVSPLGCDADYISWFFAGVAADRFTAGIRVAIVEANRPFFSFSKECAVQAKHVILGVHINDRIHEVQSVQQAFTEYGCYIKTRIGLHRVDEQVCSPRGLILLEMYGDESKSRELADRLAKIEGVEVQNMVFDHPD